MRYEVQLASSNSQQRSRVIELERHASGWRVTLDGRPLAVDAVEISPDTISILLDGQCFEISVTQSPDGKLKLQTGAHEFTAGSRPKAASKFWRPCRVKSCASS